MVNDRIPAASKMEQLQIKVLQIQYIRPSERLSITPVAQPRVAHTEVEAVDKKSHIPFLLHGGAVQLDEHVALVFLPMSAF